MTGNRGVVIALTRGDSQKLSANVDARASSNRWLLTCSCGWGRECVSAWQAQAASKLHQRIGKMDVRHAVRVEAPEPPRGQLPLV